LPNGLKPALLVAVSVGTIRRPYVQAFCDFSLKCASCGRSRLATAAKVPVGLNVIAVFVL
jgi:hypothetical protein